MASELRQRHQATTQSTSDRTQEDDPRHRRESLTELPVLEDDGQPATERTFIPTRSTSAFSDSGIDSSTASTETATEGHRNQSQSQVAKSEGKKRKIAIRVLSSVLMIGTFLGLMCLGHAYICILVALVELLLVSDLMAG